MPLTANVREIELQRLAALERQAAQFGPHTEPSVLIEIQDLRHKYPDNRWNWSIDHAQLDYDFLMNTVAGTLQRLTEHERKFAAGEKRRLIRQLVYDIWMSAITTLVLIDVVLHFVH